MKKIKVGLLLDSLIQPTWIDSVINELISCEFCDITFIGVNNLVTNDKFKGRKNGRFFSIVSSFEKKILSQRLNQFILKDISIKDRDIIFNLSGEFKNKISYLDQVSLDIVKNQNLDIIIRFGFGILKGEILSFARFGIWSFHHGDNKFYRGRPACFWEIIRKERKVGAILQVLNSELDNGVVINKCFTRIVNNSLWLTMNELFAQSSELLLNSINRIIQNNYEIYWAEKSKSIYYTNELFRYPNTYYTLLYLKQIALKFSIRKFNKVKNNWSVRIKRHNHKINGFFGFSFFGFKNINYKSKGFVADPFLRERDDFLELFVEEYDKSINKGNILKITLNKRLDILGTQVVLDLPYHISYPFIFEKNGEWFMIPETANAKRVSLFKERNDGEFIFVKDLLIGHSYFDPTLILHENKIWLFVTRKSKEGLNDCELCCFYTNDLFNDQFLPHPLNPIKMDVSSSRPAGSFFIENGELYRPSQNGSVSYGGSITVNRIVKLNEREFIEELVTEILPNWQPKLKGVHTLNFTNNYIVIDVNNG